MKQLSSEQRELLSLLVRRLEGITGIQAIVLAGSHARGRAHAGSDIDIGLFYSKPAPFSIEKIRETAESVNDVPDAGARRLDFSRTSWCRGKHHAVAARDH